MKQSRIFWIIFPVFLAVLMILAVGTFDARGAIPTHPIIETNSTAAPPFFHDFEAGIPAGFVGFADSWDGSGSTTTLAYGTALATVPQTPTVTSNHVLTVTYNVAASGSWGGGPGYAGVTYDFTTPSDWSAFSDFSFWWRGGNTGGSHRIELKSAGADPGSSNRFEYTFADDFSGWKYFSIPFTSFVKRTDFNPGAGLGDTPALDQMWGYSVLLTPGVQGNFYLDDVTVTGYSTPVDFESGIPDGFVGFADSWDGSGSSTTLAYNLVDEALPYIPEIISNTVLSVTYNVAASGSWGGGPGYAGLTHDYAATQDWSSYEGLSFWWFGGNSGGSHRIELKTAGADPGSSNRFEYTFADDFSGWKRFALPFADFVKRTDFNPGAGLGDTPALDQVWGYSVLLSPGVQGTFWFDHIAAYGGQEALKVAFDSSTYRVIEGGTAIITATLNMAASQPVTVTYTMSDGTATSSDYTAVSGQLVFSPTETAKTFQVVTVDDTQYESTETVNLSLSNPLNAALGTKSSAVLSISDNDQPNACSLNTVPVDDFENGLPSGTDGDGLDIGYVTWSDSVAGTSVSITTTLVSSGDPMALPGQSNPTHLLQVDATVNSWGGTTHAFENPAVDTWVTQDWSSYEGISFWLYGQNTGTTLFFEIQDNRNPGSTSSDAEVWNYTFTDDFSGWKYFELPFSAFNRKEIGNGAPNDGFGRTEVHGWAFGMLTTGGPVTYYLDNVVIFGQVATDVPLTVQFSQLDFHFDEGSLAQVQVSLNMTATLPVTVSYTTEPAESLNAATPDRDYTTTAGTLVFAPGETQKTFTVQFLDDNKYEGEELLRLRLSNAQNADLGSAYRGRLYIDDNDLPDPLLLDDFEAYPYQFDANGVILSTEEITPGAALALPGQGAYEHILKVQQPAALQATAGQPMFATTFSEAQDWSNQDGFSFWYYGTNSGNTLTVELQDNRTADPGPSGWSLMWSDEFSGTAGTPPDSRFWTHEIGNGFDQAINGWGNGEFEYYTDSTDNAALDGAGHLVITAEKIADPQAAGLECWYGLCEYTSARLLTADKVEVAYGRIEARLKLPYGNGLWPAFWMLGNNISEVDWPTSGEIDIMENIGIEPDMVHGTIHGPGYSGGAGIGGSYTLSSGAFSDDFHVFAIEWEPGEIRWYVDDTLFLTLTDQDIPAGTEWVYDHPFYILLNVAVGGTWPGSPDETTVFPQTMQVDYVRVFQADDTAERFTADFVDNFNGWREIFIPFADFQRGADQPQGAPNDGLTLNEVWGYGFILPDDPGQTLYFDQVRLENLKMIYFPATFTP